MNFINNNNNEGNAVVIPINPDTIMRGCPNMEIPNMEAADLPNKEMSNSNGTGTQQTPPPPGLTGCNNNKQPRELHDDGQFQNSNGNGNINKHFVANPSNMTNNFANDFSDYSQSPFNPLAMSVNNFDTRNENSREKCEELSLASNQFKLFVDETLKKVCEPSGNSLRARLLIPEDNRSARWGLKIFGAHSDLVAAAKKEIMRSPALNYQDDEVDMETSLRTSKTIESLLFEEGDNVISTSLSNQEQNICSIEFCTLASLSGLVLGPKYHVVKESLTEFDCTISWTDTLCFIPTNSPINLRISGKDSKSVSSVVELLKDRSDRIDEIQLAITTLVIDSGKLDWIYSSGAIKQVEEALWKTGGTLTQLSNSIYQVTCLSGALLSSCLKRLHEILSLHQSAHFTFRFKNDFRDFTTKCANIFETLAQVTDCAVSQKCGNGSVEVEIGGDSKNLARALIRLDTFRSQIFETGSFDLKLVERRLRLHVPAEIREFISGKKDGKLNRIIKETGVNISLNVIGGDSMYIDLILDDCMGINFGSNGLLHALRLMEGELPSELTFHVPEVHHKRMIGHGGKVIQRIMKKWGVYVKFMNSHETVQCHQLTDPLSYEKDPCTTFTGPLDNVVVRTPSKNGQALKAIKDEIFEECSVSEITGQFDSEAFKTLKMVQSSSKSRVIVSLPIKNRKSLSSILRLLQTRRSLIDSSLSMRKEVDLIVLEGEDKDKEEINEIISLMAEELKNEISVEGENGQIIIKSPKLLENNISTVSSSFSFSETSFKFFPSALFVVQSHQSLSATGSPILRSDSIISSSSSSSSFPSPSSSIVMNSLASLNPLPVGHGKNILMLGFRSGSGSGSRSSENEINFALAETRRRSADIF
jgi:hypothetical protein